MAIAEILALAALFVVASLYGGPYILRALIRSMRRLEFVEAKIFVSFIFVMGLSWFADLVGLATIIGAFAAGLIMNDCYFRDWDDDCENPRIKIKHLMAPLEAVLVPIFFVLIGAGYVAVWRGLFKDSAVDGLMVFTQNFAIRALLFRAHHCGLKQQRDLLQ